MKHKNLNSDVLNVNEIFFSIQGEGTRAGRPCVFVRLQGCMLRCAWCDTDYALDLEEVKSLMTFEQVLEKIAEYNCNFVELTGGEPLAQRNAYSFLKILCDRGYETALETNGHADISEVDKRVIKIMDIKCPDSKMSHYNNFKNISHISKNDEVKFAIASDTDFHWALDIISEYNLTKIAGDVIFSPVFDRYTPKRLAEKVLACGEKVRMQLQMHKFIWHPNAEGV